MFAFLMEKIDSLSLSRHCGETQLTFRQIEFENMKFAS